MDLFFRAQRGTWDLPWSTWSAPFRLAVSAVIVSYIFLLSFTFWLCAYHSRWSALELEHWQSNTLTINNNLIHLTNKTCSRRAASCDSHSSTCWSTYFICTIWSTYFICTICIFVIIVFQNYNYIRTKCLPAGQRYHELVALYTVTDIMLITSIRDGMNLVSYEYVACQQESHGVRGLDRTNPIPFQPIPFYFRYIQQGRKEELENTIFTHQNPRG